MMEEDLVEEISEGRIESEIQMKMTQEDLADIKYQREGE